jgi:hypothetical protein
MTWHDNADWSAVPDYLRASLKRYVNEGRIPGDFLVGILSNELDKTVNSSDAARFAEVPAILAFIVLYVPMKEFCYGSGEKMARWEEVGGLYGLERMTAREEHP